MDQPAGALSATAPSPVTDDDLINSATRERAVRALAAAAKAKHAHRVSTRVAITRSPAGAWRVVHDDSQLAAEDVSIGIQVFRGETAESSSLLGRVAWATGEVWRQVTGRRGL